MTKKAGDMNVIVNNQLIRDAYNKLDVYQIEIARKAKVSHAFFNKILLGNNSYHRSALVRRVCAAMHISYDEVVGNKVTGHEAPLSSPSGAEGVLSFAEYDKIVRAPDKPLSLQPVADVVSPISRLTRDFNLLKEHDKELVLQLVSSLSRASSYAQRMKIRLDELLCE
jgi:hypothetical protein